MTSKDSIKRASAKYDKTHTQRIFLKLNIKTDVDILEWLHNQPNKQGAIKQLIREQIEKEARA